MADSVNRQSSLLSQFKNAKIVVIGDIMLDRFVYGRVDRISPESPVPVLAVEQENYMLGGSGNTLANLSGLGAQADIIGVIGDDQDGKHISELVEGLGYSAERLIKDTSRPSIVKTRYLACHQQLLRTDYEKKNAIDERIYSVVLEQAKACIPRCKVLILSDYGKGLLGRALIQDLVELAHEHDCQVIVDPKGQDFSIYKGADAITPNKKELSEACNGANVDNDEDVVEAAQSLIQSCELGAVVATRSGDGISVVEDGQEAFHVSGSDIEVFDVSGAGDTVIAAIGACVAVGGTLQEAAELANIAGSIVVTKVGTASIRIKELEAAMNDGIDTGAHTETQASARRGRIMDWQEAAEQVRRWKARGLKVGFTNGCFDILHFGHVTYLNDARDHCDRLIMGLNTDSSISILKGPERPVHDQLSRASVIGALGSIDMVVMFGAEKAGDDNTACALLDTLKPDIYFKGGDYTVDQIPEAPTVMNNGGEVKVMPVYDGHSTTSSIAKIKKDAA